MCHLHTIAQHYAICALWSSLDDFGEPLDTHHTIDDISPYSWARMLADCAEFVEKHKPLIKAAGLSDEQVGHDLWLTRNRHGAGFWDRGLGEVGEKLTKAAHAMGAVFLYVTDDGKIEGA